MWSTPHAKHSNPSRFRAQAMQNCNQEMLGERIQNIPKAFGSELATYPNTTAETHSSKLLGALPLTEGVGGYWECNGSPHKHAHTHTDAKQLTKKLTNHLTNYFH